MDTHQWDTQNALIVVKYTLSSLRLGTVATRRFCKARKAANPLSRGRKCKNKFLYIAQRDSEYTHPHYGALREDT